MTNEDWPIAASRTTRAEPLAHGAGRGRLSSIRREFFLDDADRLSEQERALMGAMLRDLISGLADELGAVLGGDLDPDHGPLIERLWRGGLLDRPALLGLLLARADEQRIDAALRSHSAARPTGMAAQLVADENEHIASAAMALVVARGKRRDRFGRVRVEPGDLSTPESLALIELVAAAISARFGHFDPRIDQRLGEAISTLHADVVRQEPLDAKVAALVEAMADVGQLDDAALERAVAQGEIRILSAMLAKRAQVATDEAWPLLMEGGAGRFAILLRLAGVGRSTAARLVAELEGLVGIVSPVEELARFDQFSDAEVGQWRQWLATSPSYREARLALERAA